MSSTEDNTNRPLGGERKNLTDNARRLARLVGRADLANKAEDLTYGDVDEIHRDAITRISLAIATGNDNDGFSEADEATAERMPAAPMLQRALDTYRQRRGIYGDSEQRFADLMVAKFPVGLTLVSRTDWLRYGLLHQIMGKLSRYDFYHPHVDTIHDLQPYAAMLEAEDRRALGLAPFAKIVRRPEDLTG